MKEQCSSESTNFNQILGEDRLMTSPDFVQQPTSSAVSAPFRSEKWIGSVQIGRSMGLNDCMNSIATVSGIQNPIHDNMRRIFNRLSTNMTNDILNDMLNDYADLFKTILVIITMDDNMLIDDKCISTFGGEPTGQSEYQQRIFMLYNVRQLSFAPLYVTCSNDSLKVFFVDKDNESICKEISDFICKWNSEKYRGSISETINIIGNINVRINDPKSYNTHTVDAEVSSTSSESTDKDVFVPASELIKNRLEVVSQLITKMGLQLDHIQFKNKSAPASLSDLNRLSDKDKIEMVQDEIITISEFLRIATTPIHEEEVGDASSMKIEDKQDFEVPVDTKYNLNKNIVSVQQNTSRQSKLSSTLERSTTTADVQQPSMLLLQYAAPEILREPTRYQHVRMFSELTSGVCPLIQAGGEEASQQTYVEIGVPNENGTELHVGVGAVTLKKGQHPFKSIVPQKPHIDTSSIGHDGERSCLKCDKNDFNPDLEHTYLPISGEEHAQGIKEILVHLINWSRQGGGHKNRVVNENLHLCKLEFYLCVRTDPGKYRRVSPSSYSSIIEEGDGPVNINSDAVQLKELCERGGQILSLPLSVVCLKRGFRVLCNENNLNEKKFKIYKKQLLIISPPQTSNNTNLHLKILRNEYDDDIEANMERTLYEHIFNYVSHDDQSSHICSQQSFV